MSKFIPIPERWYMGAHGDPIAVFDPKGGRFLVLEDDGSVGWIDSKDLPIEPDPEPRRITADDVVVKPWRQ